MFKRLPAVRYLELGPVGGHPRAVCVLPPAQVLLITNGHESIMELVIHSFHTDTETHREMMRYNFLLLLLQKHEGIKQHAEERLVRVLTSRY